MIPPALTRRAFGRHTLVTLGTHDSHVSFVAGPAGYVHQVKLAGRDLLWNYEDGGALDANDGYRGLALVPFPNRLSEGRYTWRGRELGFPINMPDTRSALHGFGPEAHFRTDRVELGADVATAHLSYLHRPDAHAASYPFRVRFELSLAIDTRQIRARWNLTATNLEDVPIPVGLGWHPYFALPGGAGAWRVELPPNEHVELDRALPTGQRTQGLPPKRALPIDTSWDDCFALTDPADRTVVLHGEDYALELAQTGSTAYSQLYVPPGAPAVAVEPMSCNVNAFAAEPESVSLPGGQAVGIGLELALR